MTIESQLFDQLLDDWHNARVDHELLRELSSLHHLGVAYARLVAHIDSKIAARQPQDQP